MFYCDMYINIDPDKIKTYLYILRGRIKKLHCNQLKVKTIQTGMCH